MTWQMKIKIWCLLCWSVGASFVCAGPNLGMKLACKRYGDAFNGYNLSGVVAACSPDFARVWSRIPPELFNKMPRAKYSQLLDTSKTAAGGTLSAATDQGTIIFVLVGKGMDWYVDDIRRSGPNGTVISLKSYLDATLTISEFMNHFRQQNNYQFYQYIDPNFAHCVRKLPVESLDRVRQFLPPMKIQTQPIFQARGDKVTVQIPLGNGANQDQVEFFLVHRDYWRVEDYSITRADLKIPSFRQALPMIGCLLAFREFMDTAEHIHPCQFTVHCPLQEELFYLKKATSSRISPTAFGGKEMPKQMGISRCGCFAEIAYTNRILRLHLCHAGMHGCGLDQIEIGQGDRWVDLANLLAVKRKVSQFVNVAVLPQLQKWQFNTSAATTLFTNGQTILPKVKP